MSVEGRDASGGERGARRLGTRRVNGEGGWMSWKSERNAHKPASEWREGGREGGAEARAKSLRRPGRK